MSETSQGATAPAAQPGAFAPLRFHIGLGKPEVHHFLFL